MMRRGAAGMQGRGITTTNPWDPAEDSTAQRAYEADMPDVFTFYSPPPPGLSFQDRRQRRKQRRFVPGQPIPANIDRRIGSAKQRVARWPR